MAANRPASAPPGETQRNDEAPAAYGPRVDYIGRDRSLARTPRTRTMVYVQRSRTSVPDSRMFSLVRPEAIHEPTAAAVIEDEMA